MNEIRVFWYPFIRVKVISDVAIIIVELNLSSHVMKLWERVTNQRLRCETLVSLNKFGLIFG